MKFIELQNLEKKVTEYREKINIQITESERVFKKIASHIEASIIVEDDSLSEAGVAVYLSWLDKRILYIEYNYEDSSIRPLIECKFPICKMIVTNGHLDTLIDRVIDILNEEMGIK